MSGEQEGLTVPEGGNGEYRLHEALDGELPEQTIARVEEHLAGCSECAEELARLRALKARLRATCREAAPASLRERISVQYRSVTVQDGTGTASWSQTSVTRRRL